MVQATKSHYKWLLGMMHWGGGGGGGGGGGD